MKKFCLACDLVDNPELINRYIDHHRNVWDEIKDAIKHAGILEMEIYQVRNRLFMIIETTDDFSFEAKEKLDSANVYVSRWETLMNEYQQPISGAPEGVKWVLMDRIFQLTE